MGTQKNNVQVVVGLGQSGLSAVKFLVNKGFNVAVTDGNEHPVLATKLPSSVTKYFGGIDADLLAHADRIIISPGIALEHPAVATAQQLGIAIVSDIQLFHEAVSELDHDVAIVAITGSNAKSTVTTLVGDMAKDAGVNVGVGGNIGIPALSLLENDAMELAVLELSSFQLETVTNLNATVATVLNLSPDHLDRHGDMDTYCQLKHRIFQGAASIVVNRDDTMTAPQALANFSSISFGTNAPEENHFGLLTAADGDVYLAKGQHKLINTNELKIKGQHNQLNALSALALGSLAGLPLESMLKTLTTFGGLPHRCQYVASINGIDYFNDSKGTNMGSTMAAINGLGESYRSGNAQANLILVLGGQGKGQDFKELTPFINEFVSHVYLIGEDAALIEEQLFFVDGGVEYHQVGTLESAMTTIQVMLTTTDSKKADNTAAVLLSPACASFDQFTGYAQRGDQFISLVKELMEIN